MPIVINGTGTVTGLSVGGVNDGAIAHADLATSTQPIFSSYAIIADQKSAGTGGGTAFANAWTDAVLQTEIADPDSIVTIASDQFTLGAGNYLIKWKKSFFASQRVVTRLYDVTNSAVKQNSMTVGAFNNSGAVTFSHGIARVTPTGSTAYKFQYYADNQDGDGQGVDAPDDECVGIYLLVEIYKEAS